LRLRSDDPQKENFVAKTYFPFLQIKEAKYATKNGVEKLCKKW